MLIEGVKVLNAFGKVSFDDDDNGNDQTMTMMRQGVQQQVASPGSERSVGASADVGSICTLRVLVNPFYLGFNMYSRCFGLPILFGVQYAL